MHTELKVIHNYTAVEGMCMCKTRVLAPISKCPIIYPTFPILMKKKNHFIPEYINSQAILISSVVPPPKFLPMGKVFIVGKMHLSEENYAKLYSV